MINKYSLNSLYFLQKKKLNKIANVVSYIYKDKFLNETIFVINNGLVNNSFVREEQLKDSAYNVSIKKISLFNLKPNSFDIFYIYPLLYNKRLILKAKNEQFIFTKLYFRYNLVRNFLYRIKNKKYILNKKHLIKKRIKHYWKKSHYITFNGKMFKLGKNFLRLKTGFLMFRGNVKDVYLEHIVYLTNFLLINFNENLNYSQFLTYKYLTKWSYRRILKEFKTIKKLRINGPFHLYYSKRKKHLILLNKVANFVFYKNRTKFKLSKFNSFSMLSTLTNYYFLHFLKNLFSRIIVEGKFFSHFYFFQNWWDEKLILFYWNKIFLNTYNQKIYIKIK